jgi:protein YIPF5/7
MKKGKVHFGYIYGVGVVGCVGVWSIVNLLSQQGVDLHRTFSILGYGLLPIVGLGLASVFVSYQVLSWI